MALSEWAYHQKFKTKDGTRLVSLRSHPCAADTKERYILWSDVQHAFKSIDHLETKNEERIFFMIDADGELWQPLRIRKKSGETYVVIYSINQKQQAEKSFNHGHVDSQNLVLGGIHPPLKALFKTSKYLYQHLKTTAKGRRDPFRQAVANFRYYHSMLMEEISRLDKAGISTLVDGKDLKQLLVETCDIEQQVSKWTYRNTCKSMLNYTSTKWDFSTSLLFIVLPLDLNPWDNLDPSSHRFRLYFMCDNWKQPGLVSVEGVPQHVHISNHSGYSLKKQEEFFQIYGDYVLRVLQMVKRGYSNSVYEIPPLDTFKILWNCDPNVTGDSIAKNTAAPLINKAISYLQELSPPKWTKKLALDRDQSAAIKTYLDIPDDDNAEGNLHRHTTFSGRLVSWMCQAHAQQYWNFEPMQKLREFVCDHRGHINMQQGRLRVELGSVAEADQFRTLLKGAEHAFLISIKLCWKTTQSYVKDLCRDIAEYGTGALELDGITADINLHGLSEYTHSFFDTEILGNKYVKLVTIINYPRHQEQYIHISGASLQSMLSSIRPPSNWVDLISDLNRIRNLISEAAVEVDCNIAASELKLVLEKHNIPTATVVTIYGQGWKVIFDQESGHFIKAHSQDMACPKGVLSAGSIRTLGVHLNDLDIDKEFFQMVRSKTLLQDLIISHRGRDLFCSVEHLVMMWHTSACPFHLTLLDHIQDTQGRVVAQLAVRKGDIDSARNTSTDIPGRYTNPRFCQQQAVEMVPSIVFLQWDNDHVFSRLSDYSASFLNMAARQHPSVVTSLTLDVSRLSPVGLASIQGFLRRSSLEHLNIVCTLFDPSQANEIVRVLDSTQWTILKSLIFTGDNVDEWCRIWPSPVFPRLFSLRFEGSPSSLQVLSHPSVLFVQQLIYSSPLTDLCLRNVQLQDKHDWSLIIDSIGLASLQTLNLGQHGTTQLLSVPDAINLFVSGLGASYSEVEGPKLVLPSFMLDIMTLRPTGLAHVQEMLAHVQEMLIHFILEKLFIKCESIGLNMDAARQWLERLRGTSLRKYKDPSEESLLLKRRLLIFILCTNVLILLSYVRGVFDNSQ